MSPETHLLRQVHPSFVQSGQITSQVFQPTPKDELKLSVYDGDMIEPADSYEHYTNAQKNGLVSSTRPSLFLIVTDSRLFLVLNQMDLSATVVFADDF